MDMKKILENMDAAAVGNKPFAGDTNFNDMKKILEGFDTVTKTQKETINETAAVTMTADTPSQVGELMSMMRNAGMDPKVMPGNDLPMVPNAKLDDPKIPGKDDVPGDVDLKAGLLGKIAGGALGGAAGSAGGAAIGSKYGAMAGNAIAPGVGGPIGAAIGSAVGSAAPAVAGAELVGGEDADIDMSPTDQELADEADNELSRMKTVAGLPHGDVEEDYANEPDEDYAPYSDMVKGGDDISKSKKSHKPVAGGDNPMALEDSIREQLWAALNEKMAVEGRGRGKKTLKASRGEKLNASRGSKLMASRGRGKKK